MSPSTLGGAHRSRLPPRDHALFYTTDRILTFRGATDVSRGTSIGRALGVLGKSVLSRPVKVVCQVLSVTTDLLILKVAGIVCMEAQGTGQRDSALAPVYPALPLTSLSHL